MRSPILKGKVADAVQVGKHQVTRNVFRLQFPAAQAQAQAGGGPVTVSK